MNEIVIGKPKFFNEELFLKRVEQIVKSSVWSNNATYSQQVEKFYLDVESVVFCNATLALELVIKSLNLPRGSSIAIPAYTFGATANAVVNSGHNPIFIDSSNNYCMSISDLEKKLELFKIDVVIPVHVLGNLCNIEYLNTLPIPVIYDAAHCNGMTYKGKDLGAYGEGAVYSFHPTKLAGGMELGIYRSTSKERCSRLRELRNFGYNPLVVDDSDIEYKNGTNAKANEISCAGALTQLEYLQSIKTYYKEIYSLYKEHLPEGFKLVEPNTEESNYSYVTIQTKEDTYEIQDYLKSYGIFTRKYFHPLNVNSAFLYVGQEDDCPNAMNLYKKSLSLPTGLSVTPEEVKYVCSRLKKFN